MALRARLPGFCKAIKKLPASLRGVFTLMVYGLSVKEYADPVAVFFAVFGGVQPKYFLKTVVKCAAEL